MFEVADQAVCDCAIAVQSRLLNKLSSLHGRWLAISGEENIVVCHYATQYHVATQCNAC
jgi:hypothetical protein